MKLLRYGPRGAEKPGLLDAQGRVRDLSGIIPDISGNALRPDGIAALRALDPETLPLVAGIPQDDLRLGACVGGIGKYVCIGLNYADHAQEAGMPIPEEPIIFNKWTSAVVGPNDDIQVPRGSVKTDWEVELGVVIGEPGAYIDEANAMNHVAGLCVINDVSERDFQLNRAGTWDKGKGWMRSRGSVRFLVVCLSQSCSPTNCPAARLSYWSMVTKTTSCPCNRCPKPPKRFRPLGGKRSMPTS